jgi:hypothetical protein
MAIALDLVKTLLGVVPCPKSDRLHFSRSLHPQNPLDSENCPNGAGAQPLGFRRTHQNLPDSRSSRGSQPVLRMVFVLRGCFGSYPSGDSQSSRIKLA